MLLVDGQAREGVNKEQLWNRNEQTNKRMDVK
jgi:hypothetical protein